MNSNGVIEKLNNYLNQIDQIRSDSYNIGIPKLEILDHLISLYFEKTFGSILKLEDTNYFTSLNLRALGRYTYEEEAKELFEDAIIARHNSLITIITEVKEFGIESKFKRFLKKSGGKHTINLYFYKFEGELPNYMLLIIIIGLVIFYIIK